MTLDEAIAHAKEVASEQRRRSGICTVDDSECDKFSNCINCAEEHEQLASWLEDLKRRIEHDDELMGNVELKNAYKSGYNKAINDFADELKHSLLNNYRHFLRMDSDGFEWLTTDAVETHIDETLKKFIVK